MHPNEIQNFIKNFYGYGNLSAPIWFVGMEEAGVENMHQFKARLDAWIYFGRPVVADAATFHSQLGIHHLFDDEKPRVQNTWRKLLRTFLFATQDVDELNNDQIREAQREDWLRATSQNCMVELLPLPKAAANAWPYEGLSSDPGLASLQAYRQTYTPTRIEGLRALIEKHQPAAVVFCSQNDWYVSRWKEIAGTENWENHARFCKAQVADVSFYIVAHPTSHGMANEVYDNIGRNIRDALS